MFQYQTEYRCNSGESAIKEVKVRRKDKVSERTIKSKSEEEEKVKVEQYFCCLTRSFHPRGASWRNRSVPNIAGAKHSGNQELHFRHYFYRLVCDLNI